MPLASRRYGSDWDLAVLPNPYRISAPPPPSSPGQARSPETLLSRAMLLVRIVLLGLCLARVEAAAGPRSSGFELLLALAIVAALARSFYRIFRAGGRMP